MTNLLYNTWNAPLNQLPSTVLPAFIAVDATVLTPTTMKIAIKNSSV